MRGLALIVAVVTAISCSDDSGGEASDDAGGGAAGEGSGASSAVAGSVSAEGGRGGAAPAGGEAGGAGTGPTIDQGGAAGRDAVGGEGGIAGQDAVGDEGGAAGRDAVGGEGGGGAVGPARQWGETCALTEDCFSGLVCTILSPRGDVDPEPHCWAPPGSGVLCSDDYPSSEGCPEGDYCNLEQDRNFDPIAVCRAHAPGTEGAFCEWDDETWDCAEGFTCHPFGNCHADPNIGEPCTYLWDFELQPLAIDCVPNAFCSAADLTCHPILVPLGEPCREAQSIIGALRSPECGEGTHCDVEASWLCVTDE
jgi:hypothetical protein